MFEGTQKIILNSIMNYFGDSLLGIPTSWDSVVRDSDPKL